MLPSDSKMSDDRPKSERESLSPEEKPMTVIQTDSDEHSCQDQAFDTLRRTVSNRLSDEGPENIVFGTGTNGLLVIQNWSVSEPSSRISKFVFLLSSLRVVSGVVLVLGLLFEALPVQPATAARTATAENRKRARLEGDIS